MTTSSDGGGSDPNDRMNEPLPPADAAGYLIEMLSSMSHFAHISNLQNSAVTLAAASRAVDQECRFLTDGPPKFSHGEMPNWPFPLPSVGDDNPPEGEG